MLLIVHILIEEIQDIHCHTIGFAGRAVGIKVDSILVVVQSQLPVTLFAIGISQEIKSFVPVGRVGDQRFIELPDSFCYIPLIDKLFDSFQLLRIVLSSGLLEYKDSFYLETTNKYSVKNKKNGEIKYGFVTLRVFHLYRDF